MSLYSENGTKLLMEHGDEKNKNKLGEWRVFADTVGIKSEHMAVCDLPYN